MGQDWFSQKEIELAGHAPTPIMQNGPTATTNVQGPGIPQPPAQPARMGGPPTGQNYGGAQTLNPQAVGEGFLPAAGHFLKENLPMIGATVAGGTAAALTGGMSLPVQAGIGMLSAGAGAGAGKGLEMGIDSANGVPAPPDWPSQMWGSAVMDGMIPELTGQALGFGVRQAGNIKARVGAADRNAKLVERAANPKGLPISRSGNEVGRPIQEKIDVNRQATFDPLKQGYTKELQGPFGQAQRHLPIGPRTATGAQVTMPQGPTNAARHQMRSDALDDMRAYAKSGEKPKAVRRERMAAERQLQEMEQAALDNGLSMNHYNKLRDAWDKASEQFNNNFMKQTGKQKGSNFIHMLTQPSRWKGYKMSTGTAVKKAADNPDLVRNLKQNINDPDAWEALQVAVQKRIVRNATGMNNRINPARLHKQLDDMVANGAKDLVPKAKELRELANLLDKHAGTPEVPGVGYKIGMVNSMLRKMGLDTPDLARAQKLAPQGAKGKGQRITERAGQIGTSAILGTED